MNDENRKNRLIALIGTIAFHVVILVAMLIGVMRYSASEPRKWPPVDSSEILFGGEYVMLGDNYAPQNDNRPAPSAPSINQSEPEPLVTSQEQSPAKIKETAIPENPDPTKEEIAERERQRQQDEASKRIKNRVKFGASSSNSGTGKTGSPTGNAAVGAANGMPGHSLKGRTLESFGRPKSTLSGTIRIKVRVNRQGYVIGKPEYAGGEGPASANLTMRQRCIAASQESRFSVSVDAEAEQVGIITWHFE